MTERAHRPPPPPRMPVPRVEVRVEGVEVRKALGWGYESRISRECRWFMDDRPASDWKVEHVGPAHPNQPGAKLWVMGGFPYWFWRPTRAWAIRRARRWQQGKDDERARQASAVRV